VTRHEFLAALHARIFGIHPEDNEFKPVVGAASKSEWHLSVTCPSLSPPPHGDRVNPTS
jgi:hypothetical protein